MRVTIDSMAWLPKDHLTQDAISSLKKKLTVYPRKIGDFPGPDPEPVLLYRDLPTQFGVARQFFLSRRKAEHEIIYRVTTGNQSNWTEDLNFAGTLYPDQCDSVNAIVSSYNNGELGGILNAPTGCLAGDTKVDILLNDEHQNISIQELVQLYHSLYTDLIFVLSSNEDGTVKYHHLLNAYNSGVKPVFTLKTSSGNEIKATKDHRFLTDNGWKVLADLVPGSKVYVNAGEGYTVSTSVVSVSLTGEEETFDLEMDGEPHNFLANGIVVHNSGKTVCACSVVSQVQVPTLVVVHKEFLLDQWVERINTFLPNAKVGVIQQDRCEVEGNHIVVGLIQTLARRDYADLHKNSFGMLIFDECLTGDSLITTDQGLIPISEMEYQRDISVLTLNEEQKVWEYKKVKRFLRRDPKKTRTISFADQKLRCTSNHLIMTYHGWIPAEDLKMGDIVVSPHIWRLESTPKDVPIEPEINCISTFRKVTEVTEENDIYEPVYDLEIEDNHNFVANGLLVHNCHHVGAGTWADIPSRFNARFRLGLSATPKRADGADDVFLYHLGPILHQSKVIRLTPNVRRVWTDFKLLKTEKLNPAQITRSLLIKFLCASTARNRLIIDQLIKACQAGRKILVLSERIKHLQVLAKMLSEETHELHPRPTIGFCVGGMTQEAIATNCEAQVLFGTVQMVSEAFDHPPLDTLFLTTPISNATQAIGRVLRPFSGKKDPVVVDFRDDKVPQFMRSGQARDATYAKLKGK